jgi:hypothetical protein
MAIVNAQPMTERIAQHYQDKFEAHQLDKACARFD